MERHLIRLAGTVQGVGFRPFVYRLAVDLGLSGCIRNTTEGVELEVEGRGHCLDEFGRRLLDEAPPAARIDAIDTTPVPARYDAGFRIEPSAAHGRITLAVSPDLATCDACLRELFDARDRRYRYPFINCTHCGPRYSIIARLPYDRPHTSMRGFHMCPKCQEEYDSPADRRFHAQPNACPACGPRLSLWNGRGHTVATSDEALMQAAERIRAGAIVALKGLGGFQLLVDARNNDAVHRLRQRKSRPDKPFAVMFPDVRGIEAACRVAPEELQLLKSSAAPIVLLDRDAGGGLAEGVAPGLAWLGAMLPYTPLHHVLLRELGLPIVATSGNRSDEPICIDAHEAFERLADIADVYLVHDRPIVRPVDDSVTRVVLGKESVLRRARGYAPAPFIVPGPIPPAMALGGHLKNTIAVSTGSQFVVSQHIGDLETRQSLEAFEHTVQSVKELYDVAPEWVAVDRHPDYASTRYAARLSVPTVAVQHHYAHAMAVAVEHDVAPPFLAAVWDGTGYGDDRTIWGGEFLAVTEHGYERVGHLRPFMLPGGDKAATEPRRCAASLLYQLYGEACWETVHLASTEIFSERERRLLRGMLRTGLQCVETTSAGRLFDAVASLLGVCQRASYEGQAAMALECLAAQGSTRRPYAIPLVNPGTAAVLDWRPAVAAMAKDVRDGVARADISYSFHHVLAGAIVDVARARQTPRLVLGGGCFQNALLLRLAVEQAEAAGIEVFWPQRAPANDGGLALGQLAAAVRGLRAGKEQAPCA
jgi:hydrogenase maturation protein HypF